LPARIQALGVAISVQQANAKGQTAGFVYDVGGRILTRTEPDLVSAWTYDTLDQIPLEKIISQALASVAAMNARFGSFMPPASRLPIAP
jgi:hypothetical protein